MSSGEQLVELARKHLGEKYVLGALAPKNRSAWDGPWDCAEFVSWCVYQTAGILYGCYDNQAEPATADAYTGYWARDAQRLGHQISVAAAAKIPGAVVLRVGAKMGHIVISDGRGGTVEAHSATRGVISHTLSGRRWDLGLLIPGLSCPASGEEGEFTPPALVYRLTSPVTRGADILKIQQKLLEQGFNPEGLDGAYGPKTLAAVTAFQGAQGLMPDGEVGPDTAQALGISLK